MNYNYYRNRGGWGTNQYQFPAPLAPTFQPQPSWGGMDYFRAHAESPDLSLYQHAWNRVRNYSGAGGGDMGVGMNEARHWHRRAYGGLGNATQMLPEEIGHAAAYEAYRTWMHNSSIYEPLSGDAERQREGLIGLAIAEATRLLAYAGRARDGYSRMEASEAAAATGSVIFAQSRGMDMEVMDRGYGSRSRAGSFSGGYGGRSPSPYGGGSPYHGGGSSYPMSSSFDPYSGDSGVMFPRRSRSHSRSRRHSSSSHRSPAIIIPPPSPGYGASPVPIPGYGNYGGRVSPYGQTMAAPAPMYAGTSAPSYGYAGSNVPMTAAPGTLVIPSSRRHRHSISSGSHHRSRSASGYALAGSPSYRY